MHSLVDQERVKGYVEGQTGNAVGWFVFRRNTPLAPTYREQIVHEGLMVALEQYRHFVLAVFTASYSAVPNNLAVDFQVFSLSPDTTVPVDVVNLDQSLHEGYKTLAIPTTHVTSPQHALHGILEPLRCVPDPRCLLV